MADATVVERPAQTKGERTRSRLLELAVERFGAQGYRATSVSEIARAAGLTQAAAYAYFDSKEALFDAAVDADATALLDEAEGAYRDTPVRQLVPMLLVAVLGRLDRHPLVHRVLRGQEPEALERLVRLPALARFTTDLADAVRQAQQTGEVRPDLDPDMFASGAETIVLSLLMSIAQVGSSTETRRQMGVVSIFDAVLRPAPAS